MLVFIYIYPKMPCSGESQMGPRMGMECDGVKDCDATCNLADRYNITYKECYDDEDPERCSICPKDYGYPKRAAGDIWSASFRCYKMDNGTRRPICAIPCNGVDECPGRGQN